MGGGGERYGNGLAKRQKEMEFSHDGSESTEGYESWSDGDLDMSEDILLTEGVAGGGET